MIIGEILGAPLVLILIHVELCKFGLDVCVCTIGNIDDVKTIEATGFHNETLEFSQ